MSNGHNCICNDLLLTFHFSEVVSSTESSSTMTSTHIFSIVYVSDKINQFYTAYTFYPPHWLLFFWFGFSWKQMLFKNLYYV